MFEDKSRFVRLSRPWNVEGTSVWIELPDKSSDTRLAPSPTKVFAGIIVRRLCDRSIDTTLCCSPKTGGGIVLTPILLKLSDTHEPTPFA